MLGLPGLPNLYVREAAKAVASFFGTPDATTFSKAVSLGRHSFWYVFEMNGFEVRERHLYRISNIMNGNYPISTYVRRKNKNQKKIKKKSNQKIK